MPAVITSSSFGTMSAAGTSLNVTLPAFVAGDLMYLLIQGTPNTTFFNGQQGWTRVQAQAFNTRSYHIFARKMIEGDPTNWTFTAPTNTTASYFAFGIRGHSVNDVSADVLYGAYWRRQDNGGTQALVRAPQIATTVANALIIAVTGEASTGLQARPATSLNGFTAVGAREETSGFIEDITAWQKLLPSAGPSGNVDLTYPTTSANGIGWQFAVPSAAEAAQGLDVGRGNRMFFFVGGGQNNPSPIELFRRGYPVGVTNPVQWMLDQIAAGQSFSMGHRGASQTPGMPEMSARGYEYTAMRQYPILEISANITSDNVWVGAHDADLNRTSQTSGLGTIRSMTWAQVQAYQNSLNAAGSSVKYERLIDLLDQWTPTHIIAADPKAGASTSMQNFVDTLLAHGGPTKIMGKWVGANASARFVAGVFRAAGFKVGGYWYDADYQNGDIAASHSSFDISGMAYDAPQATWDYLVGLGKPIIGHVLPSQAAADTAYAKGARILQCARPDLIAVRRPF